MPNDNPALHGGVTWVCLETTGPARAIHEERERPTIPVVESAIVARKENVEAAIDTSLEALVAAVGIVIDAPAPAASGVVPIADDDEGEDNDILVEELPPLETIEIEGPGLAKATITLAPPPSDDAWTSFVSTLADVAIGAGSPAAAAAVTSMLTPARLNDAKLEAWRGIVRGTSEDFSACGDMMLDEWAANLLTQLIGGSAKAPALKRELRERGVAAFGFSVAA